MSDQEIRTLVVEVRARLPRGSGRSLQVTIDEAPDGSRFVSIKRWMVSEKQKGWISPRGIAIYPHELREVATALQQAVEQLGTATIVPPEGGEA